MAAYATVEEVQASMFRVMSEQERAICSALLDRAAVMIDCFGPGAKPDAKNEVSIRMVQRALGDGGDAGGVPMGATQGSMSALGYSQSWTIGSGGATGELYLGKTDRQILGLGNQIGSYSPVQDLVPEALT